MPLRTGSDHMIFRLVSVFLFLALCIGFAGYLYYNNQKHQIQAHITDELSAIADLKVNQIAAWRKERIEDAMGMFKSNLIAGSIDQFYKTPGSLESKRDIMDWMKSLQEISDYKTILLVDTKGRVRLSTGGETVKIGLRAWDRIQKSLRTKKPILSDFHEGKSAGYPHADLIAPVIMRRGGKTTPLGAFLIRINPEEFLYPLIQSWPGASTTAETLLFRRDGNGILYLNELRHRKDTALKLRLPLDKKQLPAAMAVQGRTGVFEGVDYRDVPVLAAARAVPGTPWFLIAKMDIEEIYAPTRQQAWMISIMIALLIAATGLSIVFWWRRQSAEYARIQNEASLERKALALRYDYLSKYANDIIILVDPAGTIVEANDRATASYGYTRAELLRLTVRDLYPLESLHELDTRMKQIREHNGFIFEAMHKRKNGTAFPVEISSRVIDIGGKSFYQSIIRDITERKQAEAALRESEYRYKCLVESVTDYIYTVSVEKGHAVATSHGPGCVTVTGYTSEEYAADPDLWLRMIFEEDRNTVISSTNKILAGMPSPSFEHRIIHKDGSLRWVKNTPVPRFDNRNRLIAYEGLITDVTQLKLLENQLRQAQKMEAVGQLAGGVAHDFNNILTAVIGYANLLLMKMPEHDGCREYVEHILSSSERAAHLTNSLLAFGRKQLIDLRPVNLHDVTKRVGKLLSRVIGEDLEFKTMLASEDLLILADSIQIEQVLMNLATNARDAMPDGGTLRIETAALELGEEFIRTHSYGTPGRYVYFSVADTGIGMDEKTKNRIFEPFFTTKEVGKGTGLGLSMVYGIIKQHNGYINVHSEPGKGTTFKIYFPLITTTAEEIKSKENVTIKRGTETILLAEDDEAVRDLTESALGDFGYKVIEAVDGEDAVRKFVENQDTIELLVLDIIMPKKNGKETYQEIKKIRPNIKALFMSGYTADIVHKKGILDTGLDFVLKPITPTDFLKKVREVLDAK